MTIWRHTSLRTAGVNDFVIGCHFIDIWILSHSLRLERYPCLRLGLSILHLPSSSAQLENRSILFAVASTLVNCTNSYDQKDPDPEMVELAKYAKQHVPEKHPKVRGTERTTASWVTEWHWGLCGGDCFLFLCLQGSFKG